MDDVIKGLLTAIVVGGLIAFAVGFTGLVFGYYFGLLYESPIVFGLMGWGMLPISAALAAGRQWGFVGVPAAISAISLLIWYRWRRSDKRRAAARR